MHQFRFISLVALLATLATAGCASKTEIRGAITDVNQAFQADYESILAEGGARAFKVRRGEAFVALHAALARLGMRVVDQDPDLGTLAVEAPAPSPLDAAEWRRAVESDLPRMREIARRHVGWMADMIRFEPDGVDIVINATMVEVGGTTEVSLTARMREVKPPESGMPRREYPPPTAIRLALDKIWTRMGAELRAAGRIP